MSSIETALSRFREAPTSVRADNPFTLVHSLSGPADSDELVTAFDGRAVADDIAQLWSVCRSARLFEDADYGQWGLVLLDPPMSAQRTIRERTSRPADFRVDDVVIGEFLGDQELLVVAPSEGERRRVLVALPLDARGEWFAVATELGQFLHAYFEAGGNKFWEPHRA